MSSATPPVSVLLVEDSPDYAALILRWLSGDPSKSDITLIWTDSLAAALARLSQGGIDVVLLDLGLPDSDGLETFTSLREKECDLPVIILSGADSEALALQTIQLGAQDYLVKSSCTPELLTRTVHHALVRHQLSTTRNHVEGAASPARIVGVLGSAGGAGATTVACVLAAELRHHTDQPTLLLDLDSNPGLVAFTLGIDPQFSVQDAMERADQMDRSIWEGLITRRPGNLDILTSAGTIGEAAVDIKSLRSVVTFAAAHYQWIVMDLGRLNATSAQLLRGADDVVLVSAESLSALHQCKHAIEMLHTLGIERKSVRLILNREHQADPVRRKELENLFGVRIEATLPPAHEDLYDAYLKKRLPSVTGDFRMALSALARRMAGLPDQAPKRSLLTLTSLRARFTGKTEKASTR